MNILQLSSLCKVFPNKQPDSCEFESASALKGEAFSYQIAIRNTNQYSHSEAVSVCVESELKEFVRLYAVRNVPSQMPAYNGFFYGYDDDYLSTEPGLFPDLLCPVHGKIEVYTDIWSSLWIRVRVPEDITAGVYTIKIRLSWLDEVREKVFRLKVIPAVLPPQTMKYTQWFYPECLSLYYHYETFSEAHWASIRSFMEMAADTGINMILTPIFTPATDTRRGCERPTIQLLDICKERDRYRFGFEKLDRWIDIATAAGIQYFEMVHLFTHWGAECAPKIMVTENGVTRKAFGWETSATSAEYVNFLSQLIPALRGYFDGRGLSDRVYFHISDEPSEKNIDTYKAASDIVKPLFGSYKYFDALSRIQFYHDGLVKIPVPATDHIEPFLDADIPELWAYYCCAQAVGVSNRFMAMPSYRNRILGAQLYKYDIKGFLHWGYNFYFQGKCDHSINPYITTDAGCFYPSGDAFIVYPGENGQAYPSLRLFVFHEGLQDMRALKLLEEKIGRQQVLELLGPGLTFTAYPKTDAYILSLRKTVNDMLEALC